MRAAAKWGAASTTGGFAFGGGQFLVDLGYWHPAAWLLPIIAWGVIGLAVVSGAIWLHIAWKWCRNNDWGKQMGVGLIIAGLLAGGSLIAAGVYTVMHPVADAPHEVTVAQNIAPPAPVPGAAVVDRGKNNSIEGSLFTGYPTVFDLAGEGFKGTGNIGDKDPNAGFPPPDGSYAKLPTPALQGEIHKIATELRAYNTQFDADMQQAAQIRVTTPEQAKLRSDQTTTIWRKMASDYKTIYAAKALALASEAMHRTGKVEVPKGIDENSLDIRGGSRVVQYQIAVGPHPFRSAAVFLEYLSEHLK
jgi:hypothetical protein